VEKIGFRSTRLRTVEKSYVTVPNKSMIDKPLDNLSLRTSRRVNFTLSFSHETTSERLRAIMVDLQDYLQQHPKLTEEVQIRLSALTPTSRDVTVQYFVQTTDYAEYVAVREDVYYHILQIVEQHGGSFANPTTVIRLPQWQGFGAGTTDSSIL
jgi:MscS family membrane protein